MRLMCRIILSFSSLKYRQRKKSYGIKSHCGGGQLTWPRHETSPPLNYSPNKAVVSLAMWQVTPSCWNRLSSWLFCARNSIAVFSDTIALLIDCHNLTRLDFFPSRHLKGKVYVNDAKTIQKMKKEII